MCGSSSMTRASALIVVCRYVSVVYPLMEFSINFQSHTVKFVPFHANFADIKSSICTTCSYLALYLCQWNNGDLFFRLWVQFPPWGLFLLSPDLLFGPIAGAAISFMSSHCRGSKPSNFAILWVFVTLKHVPKSAFQKKWITV